MALCAVLCCAVLGWALLSRSVWLCCGLHFPLAQAGAATATARPSGGPTFGDGLGPGVDCGDHPPTLHGARQVASSPHSAPGPCALVDTTIVAKSFFALL